MTTSGNVLWYKSPLYEDNTPSFKVNINLNSWYDFGISEGGSIIELVCTLFNDNVSQASRNLCFIRYSQEFKAFQDRG